MDCLRLTLYPRTVNPGRRFFARFAYYKPIPKLGFLLPQIFANQVQVAAESSGVLHSSLSYFVDYGVFHDDSPVKASGETISGHSRPAPSTASRTAIRV